ncbi:hypothetical protein G4B88_021970 [Cannabis sativa]|uniref:Uncharacterized protein n=1 Tax=Cannabis sativa TaxID=3483 RepID=A0A7J6FX33_CANSA|nr:hypothetical protein G4B88_021970 [Cannabis sativa]
MVKSCSVSALQRNIVNFSFHYDYEIIHRFVRANRLSQVFNRPKVLGKVSMHARGVAVYNLSHLISTMSEYTSTILG